MALVNVEAVVRIKDKQLANKIDNLLDDTTMLQIQNLFAKTINPWVPFLEGPLSQNIEVTPQYVRYKQPYAHYQYYGIDFNHTLTYHPLASAQWDKVAMQTELPTLEAQVKDILVRRAKELYG